MSIVTRGYGGGGRRVTPTYAEFINTESVEVVEGIDTGELEDTIDVVEVEDGV